MNNRQDFALCQICECSYEVCNLLQSSSNDFYCKACFKKSLCSGNKFSGAGDTKTKDEIIKEQDRKPKKLIPHPEIYVQSPQVTNLLRGNQSSMSVMSLSKRPLQCPKPDCNKFISVCTLESHFRHEHKEVPVVTTHWDARCSSEFHPRDIRYCITQCIVLLKVINSEFLKACRTSKMALSSTSPEDLKPVMVLMSTRMAAVYIAEEENDDDDEDEDEDEEEDDNSEQAFRTGDRIIVWLASNVHTNLSYTVAISTLDNEIRQKYFGPMLTLNENPKKLCCEGNCLILTHIHCNAMTENGTKPLALDVVIHEPD